MDTGDQVCLHNSGCASLDELHVDGKSHTHCIWIALSTIWMSYQVAFVNTTVVMWLRQLDKSDPMCSGCVLCMYFLRWNSHTDLLFSSAMHLTNHGAATDIEPIDTGEQVCLIPNLWLETKSMIRDMWGDKFSQKWPGVFKAQQYCCQCPLKWSELKYQIIWRLRFY